LQHILRREKKLYPYKTNTTFRVELTRFAFLLHTFKSYHFNRHCCFFALIMYWLKVMKTVSIKNSVHLLKCLTKAERKAIPENEKYINTEHVNR
jgi:hypothetical protein